MNDWKLEFEEKLTTPEEAVKCIHDGDTVYIGTCTSTAYALTDALGERGDELKDIKISCSHIRYPTRIMTGRDKDTFAITTFFMGAQERVARADGANVDFTSMHLSQVDVFCRDIIPARVAFLEVSQPDENGFMSYGATGVALDTYVKEKAEVMEAFAAGERDILVSTTVIEVGVDVPNAALMVVENADRFGLSQLHQLRGRVGRGKHKSYCVLFQGAGGDAAKERLAALCATNDGFKIAEEDLRLRGPGDFFGSRQSGLPEMRVASFATDVGLLQEARDAALAVLKQDPILQKPEHASLRERVDEMLRRSDTTLN